MLLPSRGLRMLEAAFEAGPAIQMPWLQDATNLGCGQREIAREHSLAAGLLAVAQRAARRALN